MSEVGEPPGDGTIRARAKRPTRSIPLPPVDTDGAQQAGTDSLPQAESPTGIDGNGEGGKGTALTALRAHYLKKSLVQLQLNHELDLLTTATPNNVSTLSYLGPPFTPPPNGSPTLDLPLLRYIFRQFVITFPFMAAAPKDFYSDKLQPFAAAVLSRNLSPASVLDDDPEQTEQATRLKLLSKAERNLSMFIGSAVKLTEEEEVVRLTQADLARLEKLSKRRQKTKNKTFFEVNIVSVRAVADKGRMRRRAHEEFIIRTRRSNFSDVFVSRRYGDFKTLANELRKHHPQEPISSPPAKDRTNVSAPPGAAPLSPAPSFSSREEMSMSPLSSPAAPQHSTSSRLAREKNRLTLRAYLHSLMTSSVIANSPVLMHFLLSGATKLSSDELDDSKRREEADRVREDGRKRFAREIAGRVEGLREAVRGVKGDIMGKDGLTRIFSVIKVTPNVRDLPENYQSVLEWARISLASTIFQQLVASDNASETFASLKRVHGLMPYFMMKTALRITNPVAMIRSMLDLFLAQPFGGKSLLQRMFTSSLTEEVKNLQEDVEAVKDKVEDPIICEKLRQFVYAPKEVQDIFKLDAASERQNLITVILRSGDEPALNRMQLQRVAKASRAHALYLRQRAALDDSDDDEGPQDEDGWLYEDLRILSQLYSRLRDREQLISLIFEGFTADLLKDIITIFYSPLAQVYRAASIADSLGDLQHFINDLIKTVEATEELSQSDPHRTVQAFIDLVHRHEQHFYSFVHKVHSKGEGLFDSFMRWIELFLTVMREGLGEPLSLEFLLPHMGQERTDILAEVDKVALYHYKLKLMYENKLRKRFGQSQQGNDADAEDEATQALVEGVVGEIGFGELAQGDAEDLAAEATDEDDGDSSDFDSSSLESGSSSEEETSSEEEETDSEESSYENKTPSRTPRVPPTAPPVMSTPDRTPQLTPVKTQPQQGSTLAQRQRTMSLRASRSLTSLKEAFTRRSHEGAPPPVPPLPASARNSVRSSPRASVDRPPPSAPPSAPSVPPVPAMKPPKLRKRKYAPGVEPPELKHLPQLLPVFVEMLRPMLRPRSRTDPPELPPIPPSS